VRFEDDRIPYLEQRYRARRNMRRGR